MSLFFFYSCFHLQVLRISESNPFNAHPDDKLDYTCACFMNSTENGTTTSVMAYDGLEKILSSEPDEALTNLSYINYSYPAFHSLDFPDMLKTCEKAKGILVGSGCDTTWYYPDIFFFSALLFLGTFSIAYTLKIARNASFFPTSVSLFT